MPGFFFDILRSLLVVIGLSPQNGVRPVQLLKSEGSNHLVRKGHGAEAPQGISTGLDAWVEAVWSPDYPHHMPQTPDLEFFNVFGKSQRIEGLSALIKKHQMVNA